MSGGAREVGGDGGLELSAVLNGGDLINSAAEGLHIVSLEALRGVGALGKAMVGSALQRLRAVADAGDGGRLRRGGGGAVRGEEARGTVHASGGGGLEGDRGLEAGGDESRHRGGGGDLSGDGRGSDGGWRGGNGSDGGGLVAIDVGAELEEATGGRGGSRVASAATSAAAGGGGVGVVILREGDAEVLAADGGGRGGLEVVAARGAVSFAVEVDKSVVLVGHDAGLQVTGEGAEDSVHLRPLNVVREAADEEAVGDLLVHVNLLGPAGAGGRAGEGGAAVLLLVLLLRPAGGAIVELQEGGAVEGDGAHDGHDVLALLRSRVVDKSNALILVAADIAEGGKVLAAEVADQVLGGGVVGDLACPQNIRALLLGALAIAVHVRAAAHLVAVVAVRTAHVVLAAALEAGAQRADVGGVVRIVRERHLLGGVLERLAKADSDVGAEAVAAADLADGVDGLLAVAVVDEDGLLLRGEAAELHDLTVRSEDADEVAVGEAVHGAAEPHSVGGLAVIGAVVAAAVAVAHTAGGRRGVATHRGHGGHEGAHAGGRRGEASKAGRRERSAGADAWLGLGGGSRRSDRGRWKVTPNVNNGGAGSRSSGHGGHARERRHLHTRRRRRKARHAGKGRHDKSARRRRRGETGRESRNHLAKLKRITNDIQPYVREVNVKQPRGEICVSGQCERGQHKKRPK